MSLQLEIVAEQIKEYSESLVFSGLNFIAANDIKKIEFFLQNASQLEMFRLATSLRYLHVEVKRFLDNRSAFNIDRYVFFLSNCWLLSQALTSHESLKKEKPQIYNNIMGARANPEITTKFILRLIGTEKINLEGTLMGFIFYFLSLFGNTRGKILKWNLMLPYRSGLVPESVLHLDLPNSVPNSGVNILLSNHIEVENSFYDEKEKMIFLEKNPESKIYVDLESVKDNEIIISKLNKYYLNSDEIHAKIKSSILVTPFDLPTSNLDYLYVKDVKVIEVQKEGENEGKSINYKYLITHMEDYPLIIRIPDKSGNQLLIEQLKELRGKRNSIDGMFCKLFLERGQLTLYPLSFINKDQITYPISKSTPIDNKALLKSLYKVK